MLAYVFRCLLHGAVRNSPSEKCAIAPVTTEDAHWGRHFSILMVMASLAITYLVAMVEQSLNTSPILARGILRLIVEAPASAVTAFPYVPLFISLALIATNDAAEVSRF